MKSHAANYFLYRFFHVFLLELNTVDTSEVLKVIDLVKYAKTIAVMSTLILL